MSLLLNEEMGPGHNVLSTYGQNSSIKLVEDFAPRSLRSQIDIIAARIKGLERWSRNNGRSKQEVRVGITDWDVAHCFAVNGWELEAQ
jgi:hypothetical protein